MSCLKTSSLAFIMILAGCQQPSENLPTVTFVLKQDDAIGFRYRSSTFSSRNNRLPSQTFGAGASHTKHEHARIIYEYDDREVVMFSAEVVDIPSGDEIHYRVIVKAPVIIDASSSLVLRDVEEQTTLSVPRKLEPGEYLLSVSIVRRP